MKKFFKTLVAVVMAFALAMQGTISFAGLGGNENDAVEKGEIVPTATNVHITKYEVTKGIDDTVKMSAAEIGEELTDEQIKDKIFNGEEGEEGEEGEISRLKGAKFYIFQINDKKAFELMYNNPKDYDSFEKIKNALEKDSKKNEKEQVLTGKILGRKPEEAGKYKNLTYKGKADKEADKFEVEIKNDTDITSIKGLDLTDDDGKTSIMLKDGERFEKPVYYWIIEETKENEGSAKDIQSQWAIPIGLALPMSKYVKDKEAFSGDKIDDLYVYPKNKKGEEVKKEKTVNSEVDKDITIDNYQEFTWYLQARIPEGDLENLTYLKFKDELSDVEPTTVDGRKPLTTEEQRKLLNSGFAYIVEKPVVYIKNTIDLNNEHNKVDPLNSGFEVEDTNYDYKYYNTKDPDTKINTEATPSNLANAFELTFKQEGEGDNRRIKINDNRVRKNNDLTIIVKLKARYTGYGANAFGMGGLSEQKNYESVKDFEDDMKDTDGISDKNGISDKILNNKRINDFSLKYSHDPSVDSEKGTSEAGGNKYQPRVVTGGKKFIKYGKNDIKADKNNLLKGAEFLVTRNVLINDKPELEGTEAKGEKTIQKVMEDLDPQDTTANAYQDILDHWKQNYKGVSEKGLENQYLAIKDDKKIWISYGAAKAAIENKKDEDVVPEDTELSGEYAKDEEGAKLYRMKSTENGEFEIKGLEYSEYYPKVIFQRNGSEPEEYVLGKINIEYFLEEVKAPNGYVLPGGTNKLESNSLFRAKTRIPFTVAKDSHKNDEGHLKLDQLVDTEKVKIDGIVKGEKEDDDTKKQNELDQRQPIVNYKPRIPETGGMGRLLFIIVGLIIVAIAAIMYKRRRSEA